MSDLPINVWREGDKAYRLSMETVVRVDDALDIDYVRDCEDYLRILQPGDVVPSGATYQYIAGQYTGNVYDLDGSFTVGEAERNMIALVSMPEPEPEHQREAAEFMHAMSAPEPTQEDPTCIDIHIRLDRIEARLIRLEAADE